MKTYKVSPLNLVLVYVMLGLLTLIGLFMAYRIFSGAGAPPPLKIMVLLWLGVLLWLWYFYLRMPVAITWRDEGVLEFKSLLGSTAVPVGDCLAVTAPLLSRGFVKLTYKGGSLRLMGQMTGFYELLSTMKSHNPQVEIKNC